MATTWDLDKVNPEYELSVVRTEHADDRAARLVQEAKDGDHRRRIDFWTVLAVMGGLALIAGICAGYATGQIGGGSADDKKWSFAILTSMVSGGLGFLVNRPKK